jgi:mycothiol synthase
MLRHLKVVGACIPIPLGTIDGALVVGGCRHTLRKQYMWGYPLFLRKVAVMSEGSPSNWVTLTDSPRIAELRFRHYRGSSDLPSLVAVTMGMREADQQSYVVTEADLANEFAHTDGFDPAEDVLIAEVKGRVIGWARVWRTEDPAGLALYNHFVDLLPAWRGRSIGEAMLRYNERRLQAIARQHPADRDRRFQGTATDTETDWIAILQREGYTVFRYGFMMVRPTLNDIPDLPLPAGIEVRPVTPQHYRAVIDAWNEACRDMRGQIPISDADFEGFRQSPIFDPSLWQIAWHRDQVVGTTVNWINAQENAEFHRKRGHVELISVRRQWRGRGIAKALIARSLRLLRRRGMTEAALGVDAENPSGALHLYETMGFQVVKRGGLYRKPVG